jgi:D-3-phosphoglycerate dehydrogenase
MSKAIYEYLKKEGDMEFIIHEGHASEEELLQYVGNIDTIVVDGRTKISARIINVAAKLKVIARTGIGLDNIDLGAATRRGIFVIFPPYAETEAVAEHTILLMLAVSRKVAMADKETRKGNYWFRNKILASELADKVLGVIGLGRIGCRVAQIASKGFGMKVIAYDPFVSKEYAKEYNAELVSLEELLKTADYITIHAVLTKDTYHLINENRLKLMKKTAFLINTARGSIIDESALYKALSEGWIAGAALDVFENEPNLDPNKPLFKLENILVTPHIGGYTREAAERMSKDLGECIKKVLHGGIPPVENIANKEVLKLKAKDS